MPSTDSLKISAQEIVVFVSILSAMQLLHVSFCLLVSVAHFPHVRCQPQTKVNVHCLPETPNCLILPG